MQRIRARKSPIGPIHALAAAVLAAGTLSVSAPALAAPFGGGSVGASAVPSAMSSADIVLIEGRSGKGNRGGAKNRGDSHVFKQGGDRWDGDDWRRVDRVRDDDRRDDRGRAGDRHDDLDRVEGRHDRGNHYGWERGRHYGWDRNGMDRDLDARDLDARDLDDRRFGDRPDWRAERRDNRWTGQDIDRVNATVLLDFEAYDLPRPGPGQYYARSGDDVFLVTERTRQIIDAFMLRDLVR